MLDFDVFKGIFFEVIAAELVVVVVVVLSFVVPKVAIASFGFLGVVAGVIVEAFVVSSS